MSGQRRRQWANIMPTLVQLLVFIGFDSGWFDVGPRLQRSQQTQNICITFIQRRPNVSDIGPKLYKCYTNVLCLLGISP